MTTISDGEHREKLIAAARTIIARDGAAKFSLKQLFAESGVTKASFQRCFTNKSALLDALVAGEAQALSQMISAPAQAEPAAIAVGQTHAPTQISAPPVDAWLERRLRVFERALAALETRLEKSETSLTRAIALVEEKISAPAAVVAPTPAPQAEAPASQLRLALRKTLSETPATPAAPLPVTAPVVQTIAPPAEQHKASPEAATELKAEAAPVSVPTPVETFAMPVIPIAEPIGEREIEDFIAHARSVVQRVALQTPASQPARTLSLPRWIAWMGVAAVTLLICAGLALSNVAGATQTPPGNAIAYRDVPQDAATRLTALADSGDARAQTLLALAFLRGQYGPADNQAALRWSTAAAQQGEPVAQYVAGALLGKQDAPHAFALFEQAALHGNVKAMHNLAIAYAQGQGVAEDDRRAAAWFGRAAEQGYVDSQFDLAVLFERGQGVAQNRDAALKWYLIAAAHGDAQSKIRADELRQQMPDGEVARAALQAAAYKPQPRDNLANSVTAP